MNKKIPKKRAKELAKGGIIPEAGTTRDYYTGDWRTEKPVLDTNKCTSCMLCWIYCPDTAIMVENKKVTGINYFHCKGCGICAYECPDRIKAITMVKE